MRCDCPRLPHFTLDWPYVAFFFCLISRFFFLYVSHFLCLGIAFLSYILRSLPYNIASRFFVVFVSYPYQFCFLPSLLKDLVNESCTKNLNKTQQNSGGRVGGGAHVLRVLRVLLRLYRRPVRSAGRIGGVCAGFLQEARGGSRDAQPLPPVTSLLHEEP